MEATQRFTK